MCVCVCICVNVSPMVRAYVCMHVCLFTAAIRQGNFHDFCCVDARQLGLPTT